MVSSGTSMFNVSDGGEFSLSLSLPSSELSNSSCSSFSLGDFGQKKIIYPLLKSPLLVPSVYRQAGERERYRHTTVVLSTQPDIKAFLVLKIEMTRRVYHNLVGTASFYHLARWFERELVSSDKSAA